MRHLYTIKKMISVALMAALIFCTAGCSGKKTLPVNTEEVHITIPGMSEEKKLIFLSDLHIVTQSDEVTDVNTVNGRLSWSSYEGVTAAEQWPDWAKYINETEADLVVFGADMLDFNSRSNLDTLKAGLEEITIPYIYLRADHDIFPFNIAGADEAEYFDLQKNIAEYEDVFIEEFSDFIIVGWNNSTERLGRAGLEKIKEAAATGKPLILVTHVPVTPLGDESLSDKSREVYQDRSLLWGYYPDAYYFPNETEEGAATAELLEMIYSDDSPFTEILCGHLHFSWDGQVTEKVHQHVFSAAFERNIGIVTISGE